MKYRIKAKKWTILFAAIMIVVLPATGFADERNLQEKATDPTAILTQFQFQNIFTPSSYEASGYANQTIVQPVLPFSTGWDAFPHHVIRPTYPVSSHIADPDGPVNETSGQGDLVLFDLLLAKRKKWGTWGFGPVAIFPTASDARLGRGKYQLGPAAVFLYSGIKNWQFGALVQNPVSIGGSSDRDPVSTILVQPIAIRHFKDGWYAGWGELSMSYEWHKGNYNIPLNVRIGKIIKMGKQNLNIFLEPFYTPSGFHKGPAAEWGIKLNVTFLLP